MCKMTFMKLRLVFEDFFDIWFCQFRQFTQDYLGYPSGTQIFSLRKYLEHSLWCLPACPLYSYDGTITKNVIRLLIKLVYSLSRNQKKAVNEASNRKFCSDNQDCSGFQCKALSSKWESRTLNTGIQRKTKHKKHLPQPAGSKCLSNVVKTQCKSTGKATANEPWEQALCWCSKVQ